MQITLTLTGTRPMIQHNRRLANPIDPYTRALKQLTGKRKKTDEDIVDIMRIEARASCYETDDGLLGLPTENVWRSLYDAATAFKMGKDIKRALSATGDEVVPLLVGGEPVKVDPYLLEDGAIDYRSVKVGTNRVMRSRPIIANWSSTHTFELFEDVIDKGDLVKVWERAGRLVGIGDYRPTYGTYTAEPAL